MTDPKASVCIYYPKFETQKNFLQIYCKIYIRKNPVSFSFIFCQFVGKIKAINPTQLCCNQTYSIFYIFSSLCHVYSKNKRLSAEGSACLPNHKRQYIFHHQLMSRQNYYYISPSKMNLKQHIHQNCTQSLNCPGRRIKQEADKTVYLRRT